MPTISKPLLLVMALAFSGFFIPQQRGADKPYVRTRVAGPFTVGKNHPITVFVRITHAHLRRADVGDWPDSDTLLVVVDGNKKTIFKQTARAALGSMENRFVCRQAYIPTVGNVLVCTSTLAPTLPGDGERLQLFGVNSRGKFVPLTAPASRISHRVVLLDSRSRRRPAECDSSLSYAKPAIELTYWTGYYDAKVYYHVYPEGFSEQRDRSLFHFDELPVLVDSGRIDDWRREYQMGNVQLFLQPSLEPSAAQTVGVNLTPKSRIEYRYASFQHGWWLFVSIDNVGGYLRESDFLKLGFWGSEGEPILLGDDY